MYVTAVGREPEEDPYYLHLYRVNIDTGEMKLLNPGNGSHAVEHERQEDVLHRQLVARGHGAESALYDTLGNKVMDLEKTDVSALLAQGFKFPETFTVKADDGVTDLYGVMYKPFDFDPAKKYPIIAFVYPGPQTESVTKTFSPRQANVTLAQFGFIVMEVGNRGGNPQRSKWYHNFGYGNLRDYGLADKKAAIEQLAKRHPWIDRHARRHLRPLGRRVHVHGGDARLSRTSSRSPSRRRATTTTASTTASWSEKHDGVKEVVDKDGNVTFEYDIDKNQDLAKNLKGKLLLMTGDIDNNVHPAEHLPRRRRAHPRQQALRFPHHSRQAARLRRCRRLGVLDAGRLLLPAPARLGADRRRHAGTAARGGDPPIRRNDSGSV